MSQFKRKNKTHRARIKKLDPSDKWSAPKTIHSLVKVKKSKLIDLGVDEYMISAEEASLSFELSDIDSF